MERGNYAHQTKKKKKKKRKKKEKMKPSWALWRKRNRRAFKGVEKDFVIVRSILVSLVFIW